MTFRERLLAAWRGLPVDRVPLTTWCFGLPAPPHLAWEREGHPVPYWYSLRMEHLHTLPQPWLLEDDLRRVAAWHSLGVDDVLDVSVPWSVGPQVTWRDTAQVAGEQRILVRDYQTPAGDLHHAVRWTGEDPGPGWVVQPQHVPLFEDYTIPRAVRHLVGDPLDVPAAHCVYAAPDAEARAGFAARMADVAVAAKRVDAPVQAWSAFGMDAVVWMAGAEGAVLLAMDAPAAFAQLVEQVTETDLARTELAASTPGVDMIVMRGWYSSTDFWSPRLFERYMLPAVRRMAELAHRAGLPFAYVMTTGVERLGPRLADAGVDVLYFVDPVQDRFPLQRARELLGERITLVGGTNALSLVPGCAERLEREVREALDVLGPTGRFILHPVDALFPDTPWAGVERLIASWERYR